MCNTTCNIICDEILLHNDSVFGPISSLEEVIESMSDSSLDFVGVVYVSIDLLRVSDEHRSNKKHTHGISSQFLAKKRHKTSCINRVMLVIIT